MYPSSPNPNSWLTSVVVRPSVYLWAVLEVCQDPACGRWIGLTVRGEPFGKAGKRGVWGLGSARRDGPCLLDVLLNLTFRYSWQISYKLVFE